MNILHLSFLFYNHLYKEIKYELMLTILESILYYDYYFIIRVIE